MVEVLGLEIERLNHDAFKIKGKEKVVYIDPYKIDESEKADLILIGHEHFDHCSPEDISKVSSNETILIVNSNSVSKVSKMEAKDLLIAVPGKEFEANGIKVKAVPAYNIDKFRAPGIVFHPKEEEHCGFVVEIDGVKVYHAGDTDNIPEMENIDCDIALLPVSGTYVMTADEAVSAVKKIRPKVAIPMHYGSIVGSDEDAEKFKEKADCKVVIA